LVEFLNKPQTDSKPRRKRGQPVDILSPTMGKDINTPVQPTDGTKTIDFLKKVRRASSRIAGTRSESLGLHPAVYFYSATGSYQPSAFLAAINFISDLDSKERGIEFTKNRYAFEELILKHKYFMNQIVRHFGSGDRSLGALTRLFHYFFDGVRDGKPEDVLIPRITEEQRLDFLLPIVDAEKGVRKDFTSERKSAVYLKQAIDSAPRCGICSARVHVRSIQIDHVTAKREGGDGVVDNGQLAHPYCNSIKDQVNSVER
jgi:hypothetical protein